MKHKVNIKGAIISNDEEWIYDMFDIEATSPKKVERELNSANGNDVEVIINSPGGSVFDGSEIYTTLREYSGNVEVKVVGVAASAASVISMAGDKVSMSPTAQIMIHNASIVTGGDYRDMNHASEMLQNVNQTISSAYRLKSGMDEEDLLKMMDKETWLTPQQALEHNFIDEVMFEDNQLKMAASSFADGIIPQQVINSMREGKLKSSSNEEEYVTKNDLKEILNEFKEEITNNEPNPKEPVKETAENCNLRKLFLNLN